jgi:hypothetical protein
MTKQIGMFVAAAARYFTLWRHYLEGLDVGDEGLGLEPAAMNVGGYSAAHGEAIGTGLLLSYAEGRSRPALQGEIPSDNVGPGDTGLHLEERPAAVEPTRVPKLPHIEQRAAGEELLTPHGMASAADCQGLAFSLRSRHRRSDFGHAAGLEHPADRSTVESRVSVVDPGRACDLANRTKSGVHGVANWATPEQQAIPEKAVSGSDTKGDDAKPPWFRHNRRPWEKPIASSSR